ncbi:hypothetical protein I203_100842 [Kwoniella mangroviensis CBS 8507]|uniref:uncharacterized protein n=1 Tax=Kwoniella mangroviensis CBS 8507 TaxID=1296122 RepID=UPI00080D3367|nr:uncharacterized protein I203_02485 [Kwoniella mangroviensis CBS 8507]OCF67829.1 hypothetical protein I203_02485 [Kwoniella mangroviensis CBS 8507]
MDPIITSGNEHHSSHSHYHYHSHHQDLPLLPPNTINPKLLLPSSSSSSPQRRPLYSINQNTFLQPRPQPQPQSQIQPINLSSFDIGTQNKIASNPFHPLNQPQKEYNSIWLSEDWNSLPFSTTPTPSQYTSDTTRYSNITPVNPNPSSSFATTTFIPLHYTQNTFPSLGSLANQVEYDLSVNNSSNTIERPFIPFSDVNNQLNYPLPSIGYGQPQPRPHLQLNDFPSSSYSNQSFVPSASSFGEYPAHGMDMAQSPWDISMRGRSRTFPFNQMIPLAYTHPGYTISSERDQQQDITMGMGYQGLPYQAIDLPSSSVDQDRPTSWDISVLPQSIVPINNNHHENHEEVAEEETEFDSDDEFDNHQRDLSKHQDIPVGVESEGMGINSGVIDIELSSSSISSSIADSHPNDKTTVLALGEIASSEVASPQVGSVPGYRPYVPKSFHSPILLSTNSSSDYEYVEEEEEEEKEQEQVSRNGRYPTRLNTLKNQEEKKNNRKKIKKNKEDKKNVKVKGKGKVGCKKRSSTTSRSTSSYKATSTSSVSVGGGIGRKLGNGGAKVPTGAFLFWMMKMLAFDVYPEYVIIKNQVAYIPDTEAFAENVYSIFSEKTNQWTSFQRNLNNYIKDWPFERRAVLDTKLRSQTIEIPTIDELCVAWRNHGLSEETLQQEKQKLERWVKENKPTRTTRRIKAPNEIEFKRKSNKFDKLHGSEHDQRIGKRVRDMKKRKTQVRMEVDNEARVGEDEEVDELYSEEESKPSESQKETQARNDNRPLRASSSSSSSSSRPFWRTANNKSQTDRNVTRLDSSERIRLRLRLDGSTFSVTPEKSKDNLKRKFGSLSDEGDDEESQELDCPKELYTPSPTFTNALITPQTATNFNPALGQPSAKGYWSNVRDNCQLPTPVSMPRAVRSENSPEYMNRPSSPIENKSHSQGYSNASISSGNLVENDVFGPIVHAGKSKGKGKERE